MGNVRSLVNKMDELAGLVWTASRLFGWTGVTVRVARGKVGDLLFLLTTSGVILVTLL